MSKDIVLKELEAAAGRAEDNYRRAKAACHPSQEQYKEDWHRLEVAIADYKKMKNGR